jgi:hypothetical protein
MAPARGPDKPIARIPVVLQGASGGFGLPPVRRIAPGEWTKAARVSRSSNDVPFASEFWRAGCPNAAKSGILNRQPDLLTAMNRPWQAGVVPCGHTGARGHILAQIAPANLLNRD